MPINFLKMPIKQMALGFLEKSLASQENVCKSFGRDIALNILVTILMLQDVTVIFRRRGGDDLVQNHSEWADTVSSAPDVINMTFAPIVSLLEGLPGIQYLARAVDLYLDCKICSLYCS